MREHALGCDAHVGAPPSEKPGSPSLAELIRTLGLQTPTSEQAAIAEYPPFSEVDGVERGFRCLLSPGQGQEKQRPCHCAPRISQHTTASPERAYLA